MPGESCGFVAEQPCTVVDSVRRVVDVGRLLVEQVVAQRAVDNAWVAVEQERSVGRAGRKRRRGSDVHLVVRVHDHEAVAGVGDAPAPVGRGVRESRDLNGVLRGVRAGDASDGAVLAQHGEHLVADRTSGPTT